MNTKLKTEWNFDLLYTGENDPEIEADLVRIEQESEKFETKYKNVDFTSTPEKLVSALADYEKLMEILSTNKPGFYLFMKSDLDSGNSEIKARATLFDERAQKASNRITFFDLAIGRIPEEKREQFLNFPEMLPYRYHLKTLFDSAKHFLSEKEENIVSLLSNTSYSMWVDGQNKLLSQKTLDYKGESIPVSKALAILHTEPKDGRRELQSKINEVLKSSAPFAEAEINAIFNYKKTMDELRGFKNPYSATVLDYENDEKSVETLVKLLTDNFHISQRFYALHAKALGEKKLHYSDRAIKIGEIKKKFDLESSVSIIGEAFEKVNPKFKEWLLNFFEDGRVDVYPKKGKRGGAYCLSMDRVPTFILLNHADTIDSFETIAHEMGHAIHAKLSETQPPFYTGHSTATGEVASTFFEQVAYYEMEKLLSPEERKVALHSRLMGDMNTIFLQIMGFNFELELHNAIREKGQLSSESMAEMLKLHLEKYFGESIDVTIDDAYFFVRWSHIRTFFYVYTYAYGQIVSKALLEKWKENPSYAEQVEEFLLAGKSMSPEDIFKKIGIDTSDPEFFKLALKSIERDLAELEALIA